MGVGPDGIRRFPRLPERERFLGVNVSNGRVPIGYDRVTHKQKKLIRMIVNGMTIADACRKIGCHTNTHYRHWNYNKRYREYYLTYAQQSAHAHQQRLDAKTGRAITIIEESMDNPDPYFKHDVAVEFLKGRGHYKKNIEGRQVHSGAVIHGVAGKVDHEIGMDKELIEIFVSALVGKARGDAQINVEQHEPKIINAKVLKKLPEKIHSGLDTKVPQVIEAETVRRNQSS